MKTALILALALAGCSKSTSAMDACHKLEAAGVAKGCHEDKPGGLASAATEAVSFDLVSVPGKTGGVYRFDRDDFYENTVSSCGAAAIFAGPHCYGSKKARIFLQMNKDASLDVGKTTKAIVEGL